MLSFPATSRQRWYFDANHDAWSALNVPVVFDIHSCYEHPLRVALNDLVVRHDALRTMLCRSGDDVVQRVSPGAELTLQVEDLPGGDDSATLQRRILAILDEPFSVQNGPLLRARLLRVAPYRSVLVLSCHHAVCDGWSAGLLFRDLAELYSARKAGRTPALPELELQFPDYATWEWGLATEQPSLHWEHRLRGSSTRLPLGDRRAADTGPGTFRSFPLPVISPETARQLHHLAAARRTTPARVVTAGIVASLVPLFGPRMMIGIFVGNREQPELLDVVGDLADRVPIVVDASDDPSFAELVDRVDHEIVDALENFAPMAALAPLIRERPERASGPLLDVTVNYLPHRTQRGPRTGDVGVPRGETTEIEPAVERRSFRADRWHDGFGLVDYQHRPRPNGSIGGYLLANVSAVSPTIARHLAATTNATLGRLVIDPRQRVGTLVAPAITP